MSSWHLGPVPATQLTATWRNKQTAAADHQTRQSDEGMSSISSYVSSSTNFLYHVSPYNYQILWFFYPGSIPGFINWRKILFYTSRRLGHTLLYFTLTFIQILRIARLAGLTQPERKNSFRIFPVMELLHFPEKLGLIYFPSDTITRRF